MAETGFCGISTEVGERFWIEGGKFHRIMKRPNNPPTHRQPTRRLSMDLRRLNVSIQTIHRLNPFTRHYTNFVHFFIINSIQV